MDCHWSCQEDHLVQRHIPPHPGAGGTDVSPCLSLPASSGISHSLTPRGSGHLRGQCTVTVRILLLVLVFLLHVQANFRSLQTLHNSHFHFLQKKYL